MNRFYLQIYRHTLSAGEEDQWVDITSLGIHPDTAEYLAELGIVEIRAGHVPAQQAARVQKLMRLRRNLGVNITGAAIIIELLERVERLQEEIRQLKKR